MKTTMITPEDLKSGMVVRSKNGMRLEVTCLAGMPGDYIILGKRLDSPATGRNEAWPIRNLPTVRVEAA